jgi:hypothetical protein
MTQTLSPRPSTIKEPASVWRSGLPTERDPSEHPDELPTPGCPAPPLHRAPPKGAVPPTGTEMETRPFGTGPETATSATPEPTDAARKREI